MEVSRIQKKKNVNKQKQATSYLHTFTEFKFMHATPATFHFRVSTLGVQFM